MHACTYVHAWSFNMPSVYVRMCARVCSIVQCGNSMKLSIPVAMVYVIPVAMVYVIPVAMVYVIPVAMVYVIPVAMVYVILYVYVRKCL